MLPHPVDNVGDLAMKAPVVAATRGSGPRSATLPVSATGVVLAPADENRLDVEGLGVYDKGKNGRVVGASAVARSLQRSMTESQQDWRRHLDPYSYHRHFCCNHCCKIRVYASEKLRRVGGMKTVSRC